MQKGNIAEGEKIFEKFHSSNAASKDFQNAIWAVFQPGWLQFEKGDLTLAERHLSKAWTDSVAAGLDRITTYLVSVSQILGALIGVEAELGKTKEARVHLEALERITTKTDDPRAIASFHDGKGKVLASEGNARAAVEELKCHLK